MSDHAPPADENKLIAERRAKLAALRAAGPAFPNDFRRDALAGELLAGYADASAAALEAAPVRVHVAGRMMLRRIMGKASFVKIQDCSGQIQLFLQRDALGEVYEAFKGWDVGDIVGAYGALFRTKTGELSVRVERLRLLVKSLRPLPDKWHGLADTEARYRQRYVDLIMNPDSREVFRRRTQTVRFLRDMLDSLGFMEVETPMMQPIYGGATARPFLTHHNTLDLDLYLRIAPELYLKRLIVGGFDRVYEINRNFRNEGISSQHNPEFTMLEFYQAYTDYRGLMDLSAELLAQVAIDATGSTEVEYGGRRLDFSRIERMSLCEAVIAFWPEAEKPTLEQVRDPDWLKRHSSQSSPGEMLVDVFERVAEPHLFAPTIIYDYPVETSPLSKTNPQDPAFVERFEIYVAGMEIANAYTELNDPREQRRRFDQQLAMRERGDQEAHQMDEDYIRALCYGMPPTGGEGIGIDRLTMVLTNSKSIRDVILFPLLRPEGDIGLVETLRALDG